jgi:ketosteroid isomerase-like protein
MTQDDEYLISVAKTEFREAHNSGDLERLLAVFAPAFTDWSEGEPSFYGEEASIALRQRLKAMFERYRVDLSVIMVKITVMGAMAMDRGWHKMRLTDKRTGETSNTMYRYFETWVKMDGAWKISFVMTNKELPPRMLSEDGKSGAGQMAVQEKR